MAGKKETGKYADRMEQIKLEMAEEALKFVRWDNSLNDELLNIIKVISAEIKQNPDILTTGSEEVAQALRKMGKGDGDVAGDVAGDVVGGGVIGDLIELIRGLLDPLGAEKDFFLQIIRLVFCGCR